MIILEEDTNLIINTNDIFKEKLSLKQQITSDKSKETYVGYLINPIL